MSVRRMVGVVVVVAAMSVLGGSSAGVESGDGAVEPLVLGPEIVVGDAVAGGAALASDAVVGDAAVGGAVLAIGDSILAWHVSEGGSVPDVAGDLSDRAVFHAARPGAHVVGTAEMAAGGYDIRAQYDAVGRTGFEWVIVDGGANDLNDDCACGRCAAIMDEIVSVDARSGELVSLVRRMVGDGSKVLMLGYVSMPHHASFGFDRCAELLAELDRRSALLAESVDGAWFVDGSDAIGPDDLWAFDADLVHPSVDGAEVLGRLVADAMVAADGE